ncbi:chloride channel protein [Solitalea lacus]|uniref:chloride channel protein n=1 Tax=Solitalea lacus TaxID=2911172 RepID=UPI001EDA0554|nr:chloride channel protein [Solitalea lacus]UKJ07026.1 chloride channel protein [Solitalea lacus]
MKRNRVITLNYIKLIVSSVLVTISSILLAFSLKHLTEFMEHAIFKSVFSFAPLAFIFFPTIGITAIYFLRKYIFQNRKSKGITEIYHTIDQRKEHLPLFRIPAHYLNGFLTVIFGGSTGIEVSTVVATATTGNTIYSRRISARRYKREIMCAGITAGVAVLFSSPLAGWLFAIEVIAKKAKKTVLLSCSVAALIAWGFILKFDNEPLLHYKVNGWHWQAVPYFILLSLLGGLLSVYFTVLVTKLKGLFAKISNNFIRVNLGAISVGVMILFYPALFGDSYHGLNESLNDLEHSQNISLLFLLGIVLLKPLASSLTLGAGGDGGVFAPSIVAGAFLGLLFSLLCNKFLGTDLIPLNFALVGMGATLSGSLYAPCMSLVLVCELLPNGYDLFFPIMTACIIARFFAQKLLPYNVYSYDFYLAKQRVN